MRAFILIVTIIFCWSCTNTDRKESGRESSDSIAVSLTVDYGDIKAKQEFEAITVASGTSVMETLEQMRKNSDNLIFGDTIYPQIGKFVTSFSGIENQDSKYWVYCVNGKMANKGVSELKLIEDSNLKWILTKDSNPCD